MIPRLVLAAVTSSSGVYLDYDTGGSGIEAPRLTPPDDPCHFAVKALPSLLCFDRGDCSQLEYELATTAACYRRNYLACSADRRTLTTLADAPSSEPAEVISDGGVDPWVFGGGVLISLIGGIVLGMALGHAL